VTTWVFTATSNPMSNPSSNDTNGANPQPRPSQSPHLPDEVAAKLPQPPSPTSTSAEPVTSAVRRDIRRAFFILLGSGLLLGALTATGVVWVMDRLNLIGVPEQPQQRP